MCIHVLPWVEEQPFWFVLEGECKPPSWFVLEECGQSDQQSYLQDVSAPLWPPHPYRSHFQGSMVGVSTVESMFIAMRQPHLCDVCITSLVYRVYHLVLYTSWLSSYSLTVLGSVMLIQQAQVTEQEQGAHRFIPLPLPPLFKLPLLLLNKLCCAHTLSAIPLMKWGLLHLLTALGSRYSISSDLCLLPPVGDGDLEGNCQKGVYILKVFGEVNLIWLCFQGIQDLELIKKDSNAHQVQCTIFLALSFTLGSWSSHLTNCSSFLSIASWTIAFQCEWV